MAKMKSKKIDRRDFIKTVGLGSVSMGAVMAGCNPKNRVSGENGSLGEVPTDKMTCRTNHHSGDVVSLLGYGCMRWPLRKNANGEDEIDQDAVNELVDYAIAHGVNYFDTAPVYVRGGSETATGTALKRHPRDKFFIATKASGQRGNNTWEGGVAMYQRSLQNLQVDYLDYYLLHSVGNSIEEFNNRFFKTKLLDYFLKEREAGRIRNLGWSFHGNVETFDYILALHEDIHWDFVQIQLNYQDWKHASGRNVNAEYLYGELTKKNIPAVIMEPLLGGRLARVPAQAIAMMKALRPDDNPAQWAFRYSGTPGNVLTVLSGMVYMEHLQENIRTYSPLVPLIEKEYEMLEHVTGILVDSDYILCTECQYCMPCPYGLDIPGVFGHYNRCVSAGKLLKNSKDENYRKARRDFLIGYDRSVPKLRQASHCLECDECRPKCPQNINIPREMRRVDLYVEQLKQKLEF